MCGGGVQASKQGGQVVESLETQVTTPPKALKYLFQTPGVRARRIVKCGVLRCRIARGGRRCPGGRAWNGDTLLRMLLTESDGNGQRTP